MLSTQDFRVASTRPIHNDGADKMTNRVRYTADIALRGRLKAKILRDSHPHARIKSIYATRTLTLKDVKAVVTVPPTSPSPRLV